MLVKIVRASETAPVGGQNGNSRMQFHGAVYELECDSNLVLRVNQDPGILRSL
jgi:hypothetical protein